MGQRFSRQRRIHLADEQRGAVPARSGVVGHHLQEKSVEDDGLAVGRIDREAIGKLLRDADERGPLTLRRRDPDLAQPAPAPSLDPDESMCRQKPRSLRRAPR